MSDKNGNGGESFKFALDWAKEVLDKSMAQTEHFSARINKIEATNEGLEKRVSNLEKLKDTVFSTTKILASIIGGITAFVFGIMALANYIVNFMSKLNPPNP